MNAGRSCSHGSPHPPAGQSLAATNDLVPSPSCTERPLDSHQAAGLVAQFGAEQSPWVHPGRETSPRNSASRVARGPAPGSPAPPLRARTGPRGRRNASSCPPDRRLWPSFTKMSASNPASWCRKRRHDAGRAGSIRTPRTHRDSWPATQIDGLFFLSFQDRVSSTPAEV